MVNLDKAPKLTKNTRGEHFPGSRATNAAAACQRKAYRAEEVRRYVELHG